MTITTGEPFTDDRGITMTPYIDDEHGTAGFKITNRDGVLTCDTCGTCGTVDDAIEPDGPCAHDDCDGTIGPGDRYIYFNPSCADGDTPPSNVFVYYGTTGEPWNDGAVQWYDVEEAP